MKTLGFSGQSFKFEDQLEADTEVLKNIKTRNTFLKFLLIRAIYVSQCINFLIAKRICYMSNNNGMCMIWN